MLVKVTRPYGGAEGRRVKPGVIFSVGQKRKGFITITQARWQQLKQMNLAEETKPGTQAPAAPGARPRNRQAPTPVNRKEPDSQTPAPQQATTTRTRTRRRAQEDAPTPPRPLLRRGSQNGTQEQPASLSPADRQAGSVTLKQRGTRRGSAGSPLTTPDSPPTSQGETTSTQDSVPGPTSSMPVTADGGPGSAPSKDSAAFD